MLRMRSKKQGKQKEKEVEVSCAVIREAGRVLIAQRKPGSFYGGYWEFPGGKCHDRETLEDCLVREVWEELRIRIQPVLFLRREYHPYSDRKLALNFYLCDRVAGRPVREDCFDFRWVSVEELLKYCFPPADYGLIHDLIRKKRFYFGV